MAEKLPSREIHFRADNDLHARLQEAALKVGITPSSLARLLLRDALNIETDVKLEAARLASHTIKRATSSMLKEVARRLPEIILQEANGASAEGAE
jgi:hypothetical protein